MRNLFAALICSSLLLAGCGGGGGTLAGGGTGTGTQVSVPNVANDTQATATSALTGIGLALGSITSQVSTTVASGLVISQNPAAGMSVAQGTTVSLVLSSGGIAVPNVVGDAQAAAQSAITGAGLVVGAVTSQASSTVANGNVISENPAAGTGVVAGTSVALVVSSGAGATTAYNVANGIVDQGPAALAMAGIAAANIMYVKVTVCAPGSTTNCQTIDHVQVDTGSQGLRIVASAITDSSLLTALTPVMVSGGALAECTQFVDGYSWGPMVTADLHVGGSDTATSGESAPGISMQIIGITTYAVPAGCSSVGGTEEDTVAEFGANGIIGLGLFEEDCGTGCSQIADNGLYYSCTSSGCSPSVVPVADQSTNPVFKFAANNGITDNNGVIIKLPSVPATGAANVAGTLVFGIDTQTNNAMPSNVSVLTTDPSSGYVTTTFISQNDTTSYLDSGSNALYFDDSNIPLCTQTEVQGFFCTGAGVVDQFSATITGVNGQSAAVNFTIGDAFTLFANNQTFSSFSNLGGSASSGSSSGTGTFAWGLPFYFGRNIYTAMEHTSPGGTSGPYFAF